jgi:hypothetical protein
VIVLVFILKNMRAVHGGEIKLDAIPETPHQPPVYGGHEVANRK